MNFIMVYGPTAAGKLTVAKELRKITGYKLLDNHTILNAIAALFPFEDPKLNKIRMHLGRKFRLEMFEAAAEADVDFITTLIIGGLDSFTFMREAKSAVESHGGHVIIVQLCPTLEAVMERVQSESRKGVKVASKEHLKKELTNRPLQFEKFPDVDHLTLNNTYIEPEDVASQIVEYYHLGSKI